MKNALRFYFFLLFPVLGFISGTGATERITADKYKLSDPLAGPVGPYTRLMIEVAKDWPPKRLNSSKATDVPTVKCLSTESDDFYIGAEHFLKINAPLDRVYSVVADVDNYQRLFPGFKKVRLTNQDQNLWTIFWEQTIPVFFIPNVTYETFYVVQRAKNRVYFRFQLKSSSKLKHTDGLIVLEGHGPSTLYVEYDFFDAEYGILKTLAPKRIWKDAIEGMFLSDLAVRLKAENAEWSYEKISKSSEAILEAYPLAKVLEKREPALSLEEKSALR